METVLLKMHCPMFAYVCLCVCLFLLNLPPHNRDLIGLVSIIFSSNWNPERKTMLRSTYLMNEVLHVDLWLVISCTSICWLMRTGTKIVSFFFRNRTTHHTSRPTERDSHETQSRNMCDPREVRALSCQIESRMFAGTETKICRELNWLCKGHF